jgi:hypothetical protein
VTDLVADNGATLGQQILAWIAQQTNDDALVAQIGAATVARQDYMRTGYFIYLEVPADAPLIKESGRPVSPDIVSVELLDGAGTTLFLRDGRLHYLEIYARGGFLPPDLQDYELAAPR